MSKYTVKVEEDPVRYDQYTGKPITNEPNVWVMNAAGVGVAFMSFGSENKRADAMLFAASEDMYGALHIAADFVAATGGTSNPAYKIIASAIAKADGGGS